jgi:hypothetical protein
VRCDYAADGDFEVGFGGGHGGQWDLETTDGTFWNVSHNKQWSMLDCDFGRIFDLLSFSARKYRKAEGIS